MVEYHGHYIDYIQGNKNTVTQAISRLKNDGDQKTTHKFSYLTETMS